MKKLLFLIPLLVWSVAATAQEKKIPQRLQLAEVEINDGAVSLEVFNMPKDSVNNYYLSVGTLGIGDDVIQINFDPLFELFIPLGETLTDAMIALQQMQGLYKTSPGTFMEVQGCLAPAFPNDKLEPVKVTYRRFLVSKLLEFSVQREGYIRATHIPKTDFGALVTSMKLYRKIHPNEL
ncbi:MAG: hypothetical protein J6Z47_04665 [Bacteroidales bacterium]|nr:hypothetical protein [Bacteroidales bacterium]